MEYDSALGGIILVGGETSGSASTAYLHDTWKWDGSTWTELQPTTSPDGRQLFGLAYDTIRQQLVLFGGGGSNTSVFDSDTWTFGLPSVALTKVVSRVYHGTAGLFDIDLTSGNGTECRSGGANGAYRLVFTFANPVTSVGGANVTSGTGSVTSSNIDPSDAHNYIVSLTGVTNAQTITVSLTNVADSAGNFSPAVAGSMRVLVGDTNGDGLVNSADIGQTKSQSGQTVTTANFREDVNADGFINSADIGLVKSKSGTALP
jgi:hypothetical protein